MVKEIIIDTDIGCDSDDAGALAVAYALQYQGKCRINAITHCTSRLDGCNTIDAISRYYGVYDIPIGIYKPNGFLDKDDIPYYTRFVQQHFEHKFQLKSECPDAVKVLRQALVDSNEGNVSLVGIGPSVNLSNLLDSQPDEISELTGRELIAKKQCSLIVMAGCFEKSLYHCLANNAEWNVNQAISEAQNVFDNWPCQVFVVPFESGYDIITGKSLQETGELNPVWVSYREFGHIGRNSWDPCAVLFSIEENLSVWDISPIGKVSISDEGISSFVESNCGNHRIVHIKDKPQTTATLESLMGRKP